METMETHIGTIKIYSYIRVGIFSKKILVDRKTGASNALVDYFERNYGHDKNYTYEIKYSLVSVPA